MSGRGKRNGEEKQDDGREPEADRPKPSQGEVSWRTSQRPSGLRAATRVNESDTHILTSHCQAPTVCGMCDCDLGRTCIRMTCWKVGSLSEHPLPAAIHHGTRLGDGETASKLLSHSINASASPLPGTLSGAGRREAEPAVPLFATHPCPARPGSAPGRWATKACRPRLPCLANGGSAGQRLEERPRRPSPPLSQPRCSGPTAPGGALVPGLQPAGPPCLSVYS